MNENEEVVQDKKTITREDLQHAINTEDVATLKAFLHQTIPQYVILSKSYTKGSVDVWLGDYLLILLEEESKEIKIDHQKLKFLFELTNEGGFRWLNYVSRQNSLHCDSIISCLTDFAKKKILTYQEVLELITYKPENDYNFLCSIAKYQPKTAPKLLKLINAISDEISSQTLLEAFRLTINNGWALPHFLAYYSPDAYYRFLKMLSNWLEKKYLIVDDVLDLLSLETDKGIWAIQIFQPRINKETQNHVALHHRPVKALGLKEFEKLHEEKQQQVELEKAQQQQLYRKKQILIKTFKLMHSLYKKTPEHFSEILELMTYSTEENVPSVLSVLLRSDLTGLNGILRRMKRTKGGDQHFAKFIDVLHRNAEYPCMLLENKKQEDYLRFIKNLIYFLDRDEMSQETCQKVAKIFFNCYSEGNETYHHLHHAIRTANSKIFDLLIKFFHKLILKNFELIQFPFEVSILANKNGFTALHLTAKHQRQSMYSFLELIKEYYTHKDCIEAGKCLPNSKQSKPKTEVTSVLESLKRLLFQNVTLKSKDQKEKEANVDENQPQPYEAEPVFDNFSDYLKKVLPTAESAANLIKIVCFHQEKKQDKKPQLNLTQAKPSHQVGAPAEQNQVPPKIEQDFNELEHRDFLNLIKEKTLKDRELCFLLLRAFSFDYETIKGFPDIHWIKNFISNHLETFYFLDKLTEEEQKILQDFTAEKIGAALYITYKSTKSKDEKNFIFDLAIKKKYPPALIEKSLQEIGSIFSKQTTLQNLINRYTNIKQFVDMLVENAKFFNDEDYMTLLNESKKHIKDPKDSNYLYFMMGNIYYNYLSTVDDSFGDPAKNTDLYAQVEPCLECFNRIDTTVRVLEPDDHLMLSIFYQHISYITRSTFLQYYTLAHHHLSENDNSLNLKGDEHEPTEHYSTETPSFNRNWRLNFKAKSFMVSWAKLERRLLLDGRPEFPDSRDMIYHQLLPAIKYFESVFEKLPGTNNANPKVVTLEENNNDYSAKLRQDHNLPVEDNSEEIEEEITSVKNTSLKEKIPGSNAQEITNLDQSPPIVDAGNVDSKEKTFTEEPSIEMGWEKIDLEEDEPFKCETMLNESLKLLYDWLYFDPTVCMVSKFNLNHTTNANFSIHEPTQLFTEHCYVWLKTFIYYHFEVYEFLGSIARKNAKGKEKDHKQETKVLDNPADLNILLGSAYFLLHKFSLDKRQRKNFLDMSIDKGYVPAIMEKCLQESSSFFNIKKVPLLQKIFENYGTREFISNVNAHKRFFKDKEYIALLKYSLTYIQSSEVHFAYFELGKAYFSLNDYAKCLYYIDKISYKERVLDPLDHQELSNIYEMISKQTKNETLLLRSRSHGLHCELGEMCRVAWEKFQGKLVRYEKESFKESSYDCLIKQISSAMEENRSEEDQRELFKILEMLNGWFGCKNHKSLEFLYSDYCKTNVKQMTFFSKFEKLPKFFEIVQAFYKFIVEIQNTPSVGIIDEGESQIASQEPSLDDTEINLSGQSQSI